MKIPRIPRRKALQGAALLLMVAVVAMGASWYMVDNINARATNINAAKRIHNARVLARAKQALISYVSAQAAHSYENNPGALPCPEAAGYFNTSNEGTTAGTCTLPKVGRFPWATIGTEKLVDADGEPLWYVVASGWAKPNSSTNTVINSECSNSTSGLTCWSGQLTVDGVANDAAALLIAPGAPLIVSASTNCTARTQARSASSIDWRDYLECENATSPADATFATSGPSDSFNDQVAKISAGELLPGIEAGIAGRFALEFGAGMKNAYTNANSANSSWPATLPVLPFPATFADPSASTFQGVSGTTGGLLPLTYATTGACSTSPCVPTLCTVGSDNRCQPSFVAFTGTPTITRQSGATLYNSTCTVTAQQISCAVKVYRTSTSANGSRMNTTITMTANNVGMALRRLDVNVTNVSGYGFDTSYTAESLSGVLNASGSATLTLVHRLPVGATQLADSACGLSNTASNWCWQHDIVIPIQILSDHLLVDISNTTYNWFARNKWHQLAYYTVASGILPSGARSCTNSSTCLTVTYHASAGKQRGILIFGGSKFSNQTRPPTAVSHLLEDVNADGTSPFALRAATLKMYPPLASKYTSGQAFNDRVAVIDSNP